MCRSLLENLSCAGYLKISLDSSPSAIPSELIIRAYTRVRNVRTKRPLRSTWHAYAYLPSVSSVETR